MPTEANYYANPSQYGLEDYTTSTPEGDMRAVSYSPGYIPELLDLRQKVESGQGTPWDREWFNMQANAARAVPMRDPRTLQYNAGEDAPDRLSGGSPDLGRLMLTLQDKMRAGQASPHESELFKTAYTLLADQNYRASVPQESDQFNPLGDQFLGALGTLALGATGGLAAAPLAAGGAGLATTLGSLGTLAGIGGTAAGALGQEMDLDWLKKAGLGLGAAGGIAGGIGGLANLAGSGITSLSDAARLAGNAGRVVGGVGSIADSDALKQAGGWLGTAGQLGGGVENLRNLLGGTGGSLQGVMSLLKPLQKIAGQFMQPGGRNEPGQGTPQRPVGATASAPQRPMYMEPGVQGGAPSGIQALLQAAQQAQQRGRPLTDQDWLRQDWRLRNPAARSTLSNL